jgi:hypothetical protein
VGRVAAGLCLPGAASAGLCGVLLVDRADGGADRRANDGQPFWMRRGKSKNEISGLARIYKGSRAHLFMMFVPLQARAQTRSSLTPQQLVASVAAVLIVRAVNRATIVLLPAHADRDTNFGDTAHRSRIRSRYLVRKMLRPRRRNGARARH